MKRQTDKSELVNGIRIDLQKEEDAIITYTQQINRTSNATAKKVLTSIANEERVHVGELNKLLDIINGEEEYIEEGGNEVKRTLVMKIPYRTQLPKHKHKGHAVGKGKFILRSKK